MAIRDLTSQRLFLDVDLAPDVTIDLDLGQTNYLVNVLRARPGDPLLVFNGRDGEWRAEITVSGKRACTIRVCALERSQETGPDIAYVFALLKRTKNETVVQKATEFGVRRVVPVTTDHCQLERVNPERLKSAMIEAAEQCGILRLPDLEPLEPLDQALDGLEPDRRIVFCDEGAEVKNPVRALEALEAGPIAVLIGPEGGFSASERARLLARSTVVQISLGPRIMRADTAGLAALALVNAVLGDWR